jgi:hypothetical protein
MSDSKLDKLLNKNSKNTGPDNENEHDPSDEEIQVRERKETRYDIFKRDHGRSWRFFNVMATLGSIGLAIGTYFVVM